MGVPDTGGAFGERFFAHEDAARVAQAQGVLMELLGIGPREASQVLHRLAADAGQPSAAVAAAIVARRGLPA